MNRLLLFIAILFTQILAFAQVVENQKEYYIYNIVTFSGSLNNEGFKVDIDNGKNIEKLKDKDGDRMKFNTPAAALMYFISEDWELYVNGATNSTYQGTGTTSTYWIIRKPCSKEEFDKAIDEGKRKR